MALTYCCPVHIHLDSVMRQTRTSYTTVKVLSMNFALLQLGMNYKTVKVLIMPLALLHLGIICIPALSRLPWMKAPGLHN